VLEQTSLQPTDQPVRLAIDSTTVLVENHWVEPEGAESLKMVQRSEDMLVLRLPLRKILSHGCLLTFFWLLLLVISICLLNAPSALAKDFESPAKIIGTLTSWTVIALSVWGAYKGIREYLNCRYYFDRNNGLLQIGALTNSTCYALNDVVAIQLLEGNRPKQGRSSQLNLVLIRKQSTTLRINLQSAKQGKKEWPKFLKVMRQSANCLADFLDVPLIEQRTSDPMPIQKKFTDDAKKVERKEIEELNGTWLLVETDGRALTNEGPLRTVVRRAGHFRVRRGHDIMLQGSFRIDWTQEPKQIDLIPITGRDRGKTYLGIYILDEDIYKECFAEVGQPRPKELQFQPGISRLRVYKRIK
jgi:uncharacterized protein (TIGR03067 family)